MTCRSSFEMVVPTTPITAKTIPQSLLTSYIGLINISCKNSTT